MSENFQISDDFATFEAETHHAAQEAAKAEKMVMGINMPIGTIGKASILSMTAGKSKIKVDPKTKQQTGGNPMVTLTFHVEEPAQYVGQKVSLYFTFNATPTTTIETKYQRFYDTLEDCGMPRELRASTLAEKAKWMAEKTRTCNFEVVQHWNNTPGEKEFKPQGVGGPLPSLTDLEQAYTSPETFSPQEKVKIAGNPAEVISVETGGKVKVRFTNGQEMIVSSDHVSKE